MSIADKLSLIAENERRVYDAGKSVGITEGKQTENRALWELIQEHGERKYYAHMFASPYWTDDNFKPIYDMGGGTCLSMFMDSSITDLKGILERQGVTLDTSNATNLSALMQGSKITCCPVIDCRNVTTLESPFYNCYDLISIEKLILREDGSNIISRLIPNCESLEDLVVEGVIGQNGFNARWSTKLSKASITSIINALSTTTTGLSITLSKTAVENAFTTEEWTTLISTKTNWTINLL